MKILSKFALSFFVTCCFLLGSPLYTQAQMVGSSVGNTAPNIELPDQYGNKISLSDLRGNLVLVRFWQSGDPNSRVTNSSIYTLHEKYKNAAFKTAKGFEVFTVSFDSRLDKWKMALQQDQLPENYHVNDIYSKYVAPFGIKDFPVNLLLDENGVIIANTKSMAELDMELSKRAKIYVDASTPPSSTTSAPTISPDLINTSDRPSTFNQSTASVEDLSATSPTYMIQLGAFKNWDMNKFLDASEYGYVTAEEAGNGVKRALLGKFTSPEDVVSTLSKLRDIGYKDAFPVEYKANSRRIIGKKETATIAAQMGITVTEAIISTPPASSSAPETLNFATTTPSATNTPANNHYEYPFPTINSNSNPITSIPDDVISSTYHSGNTSVITTTTNSTPTTNNGSGVATFNSSEIINSNPTLVPSEIPVFTGGVNPATHSNSGGTYYDSDAYELSWYPSEPSQAQPNIIESPYYNNQPISQDPNAPTVPNYDNNNNNGWQQGNWNNNTNNPDNNGWNNNNNGGWSEWQPVDNMNNNTQPPVDGQWDNNNGQWNNNEQTPANTTYPTPANPELDQSLNNYLNSYDFSSVDENSERISTTKKKKKKKKRKKKKKKRR